MKKKNLQSQNLRKKFYQKNPKRKKKKTTKKGSICSFLKDSGRNPLFNIS